MKIKINREAVKETVRKAAADDARRQGAAVNWTRPQEGNNVFRIFAFTRGDTGEGAYVRRIMVHQPPNGKPIVCGKSPTREDEVSKECAHCDEAKRIEQERGRDAAGRYRARPRYAFIVVPLRIGGKLISGEDRRPKVFQASKTVGEKINALIADEDICEDPSDFFGCEGADVKIKYDPSAKGAAMYTVGVLDSSKWKTLDADLQTQAQKMDLFGDMSLEPEWYDGPDGGGSSASTDEDEDDEGSESDYTEESDGDDDYTAEERETLDATNAKLAEVGLADEYDVEIDAESGKPIFYKVSDGEDAQGSWDFPEVVKPKKRGRRKAPAKTNPEDGSNASEEAVEKAQSGFKPRSGAKKRRPAPADEGAEDADE